MTQVLPRPRLVRQTNEHWLLPAPALEQWWSAGTVEERDAIIAANKSDEPLHGLDAQESEPDWLQRTTAQDSFAEEFEFPKAYWLQCTAQAQDFEPCCLQDALAEKPIVHRFDEFEAVEVTAVPAEDLGEIPTWADCPRLTSCRDEDGNYIARTQEEMDAALAERDAREAAQPIAEHPFDDLEDEPEVDADDLGVFNDPPPPMVRCYSNMGTDFALPEPEYLLAMAAHEAEQAEAEQAAHEAAEKAAFLEEFKRKEREGRERQRREWKLEHSRRYEFDEDEFDEQAEAYEFYDKLPEEPGEKDQAYHAFRLKRDPSYRHGNEFTVPPAQEGLYKEFRKTVIERSRWSEPTIAELRKAWETFLAARGLEIVLG